MKNLLFMIFIVFGSSVYAQQKHVHKDSTISSSKSLGDWLREGETEMHIRSFYMNTQNRGLLLDYSTLAFGGGLGYSSPSYKGFHFGFSGFFVFQLHEQNIRIPDPSTGNVNRYEILLYDMNDFENTRDLDRLEHLYLSYEHKGFELVFGRQRINSPLLNEQDNRMRPNTFSGLTFQFESNDWQLFAGLLSHVTMRGTVDWYSIENSFGVYPFGRNPLGEPLAYKDNIESKGIAMAGIKKNHNFGSYQLWNYYSENVFNTVFSQSDVSIVFPGFNLDLGIQAFYQTPLNHGGNENPAMAYMLKKENTYGVGGKIGLHRGSRSFSLNYLGISDRGRFLFPREWGRERFYASLPRERFEGNGGVMALTAWYNWKPEISSWKGSFGASTVSNPDISNINLNKYGVPSYFHIMGELAHSFKDDLEGLELRLLLVNKIAKNPNTVPDQFRINRVDMWNINLIVDYKF
ncbi:hypothetical protein MM236_18735 [Belliella sp. DSM 107340]|uniref:Outer membrane porin, OprD family n=1 Tax=Belliella calami TaxID=2923436 RepID=A0ABS9UTT6_9BACT|nr:hypothetical protein [Belliella calami]